MDKNLVMDFEAQKKLQEEKEAKEQKRGAWFFQKLAPASLIYTMIYTICRYQNVSGITIPFWVMAVIGYACYALKIMNKKVKKDSIFLIVVMLLLGICTFTTGNIWIIWLNDAALFLLLVCFLLKNLKDEGNWDFDRYIAGVVTAVSGAVGAVGRPFSDGNAFVKMRKKKEDTKAKYVTAGILLAIPCVLFLSVLLMSADMVFKNLVTGFLGEFHFPARMTGIIFMMLFGFFSSYCGVRYLTKEQESEKKQERRKGESVFAITVTAFIAVLYLVFCGIQIMYLFIGKMKLPAGMTYAQYARSGFFQLLFVCILNLILVLSVEKYFQKHKVLDAILLVISGCTMIMTASSAWRMLLYIRAYYLTFLRVAVLAALVVIALLLCGTMAYILRPSFPLLKYGVAVVSVGYLVFAFSHVDYLIASYNLAQIEKQECTTYVKQYEAADYEYLSTLSTDAAPAIHAYLKEHPQAGCAKTEYGYFDWKNVYTSKIRLESEHTTWRNFNISKYAAYRLFETGA